MRSNVQIMLLLPLRLTITAQVAAQVPTGAQRVDELRSPVAETRAKEPKLRARVGQLAENINPDHIDRSLAGVGSTRTEELREQRRRQLSIERDGLRTQLKLLATSRERLEQSIRAAEGVAYQQSAEVVTPAVSQALIGQTSFSSRLIALTAVFALTIAGLIFGIALVRRRSSTSR